MSGLKRTRKQDCETSDGEDGDAKLLFLAIEEDANKSVVQRRLGPVSSEALSQLFPPSRFDTWPQTAHMPWRLPKTAPRRTENYRCTSLHLAAVAGKLEVCRWLVQKGADPRQGDTCGNQALILAAASGCVETAKAIMACGGQASDTNNMGTSALHVACKQASGGSEMVRLLLSQPGIDVNAASSYDDEIPLLCAAYSGNKDLVNVLISEGADVNRASSCKLTALHMAARKNYPPMIDLLVKHGADVNAQAMCTRFYHRKLRYPLKDYAVHKGTPLLFAVETTTNGKTVKALLGHGADPEIVTGKTPYTPLMWAAHRLKIDIVKMLLEAGALPNHSAHHGRDLEGASNLEGRSPEPEMSSPIIQAIRGFVPGGWEVMEAKILECVKLLVESGVSVHGRGRHGRTCLQVCVMAQVSEVFGYLLEKGADPMAENWAGETAMTSIYRGEGGNLRPWLFQCIKGGVLTKETIDSSSKRSPLLYALRNNDVNLMQMLAASGCLLQRDTWMIGKKHGLLTSKEVARFTISIAWSVKTLQDLCRQQISATIGRRPERNARIQGLPIPNKLKQYLMFEDLRQLIRSDSSNDQPFHAEKCKNMDKSLIPYLSDDERYVSSDSSDASEDSE